MSLEWQDRSGKKGWSKNAMHPQRRRKEEIKVWREYEDKLINEKNDWSRDSKTIKVGPWEKVP